MSSPLAALAFTVPPTRLSIFDTALVAVYLVAITLFGLRFREKKGEGKADKSLKSYFLANNTIPWWAIALSIVSAETSTLTIVSIPGLAYASNFGFLQLVIGYMFGRIVVALLFLPRYFAGEMLTAYQLIDRRFGPVLHKVTAGLFLLTRAAAEGVRVFAVSIVVGIAIGTKDVLSIGIICALTLLYTFEGGMTAVIWTDVVQMFIYIGGTLVAILTLGSHVHGGWTEIHHVAAAAGRFHMLDFTLNLTSTYTFWAGVVGGTFLTMASHGTDQLMVQRMLAARNLRESQLALLSSGAVIFLQFTLFLVIGAGLYVFYEQHPAVFASSDRIFPTFIVREMPVGIAGLLVAAILAAAMSNLSAALNSLSSTTVVDFYMRLRPNADERERGIIAKSSTVVWALALFAIAVYSVQAGGKGHVVEIGLSIASVAYGCLLGVFLLGTLTRYANEVGASIGMVCGFALNVWLWQGVFPVNIGPLMIPKIAYPWYTVIGAGVTFLVGSLASFIFGKRAPRRAAIVAAMLLFAASVTPLALSQSKSDKDVMREDVAPPPNFTQVSTLINSAIAAHKLPGAVVIVGHSGHIVFHQAYGNRKLAGEPGLDGSPTPAEPMTEETIFDMASLTKDLATATAVMQLYEQDKFEFDDPIEKYFPDFNTTDDPQRAEVTIRMLLTHFSGEPADISLKDPWGLAAPDRMEGVRRAVSTPLQSAPGKVFRYSDINFILLGLLVEKLSGESEDSYVQEHIYKPLGMEHTRYLPFGRACGPRWVMGSAVHWAPPARGVNLTTCPAGSWSTSVIADIAPTAHDNEGAVETNPDFDQLLRGTVHDPTTRRMGGVAGHAGLFSTAHDVALFAQGLLDRLAGRPSDFPLKQATLELMTTPEQPGHMADELSEANAATRIAGTNAADPLLAAAYPAIKGRDLRGYGWDIDTAFSKPRGAIFPIGSFGHTGFTGTTLWMDPGSDTYYVLLANAIHPRGGAPISNLRGEVATVTARALRLYGSGEKADPLKHRVDEPADHARHETLLHELEPQSGPCTSAVTASCPTRTGLDVLESTHFSQLSALAAQHGNHLRVGLLTNQAGLDANRRRTIDIFANDLPKALPQAKLVALFSPEHGISGKQETANIADEVEPATGLHVFSLYGAKPEQRHPTHEQLKDLDAVVIDLQDAGVHFWTYEAVMGYFLEASAREQNEFHHQLDIIILDRPNLVGGVAVQGPVSDPGIENYTNYMSEASRHGMTYGELARYFNTYKLDAAGKALNAPLTVIQMQHWTRDEYFADTHLPWVDPSPNLRDPIAAILYPGLGLIETTNISVGRGTDMPFHMIGAGIPAKDAKTGEQKPAWFKGADVAAALTARHIPGVTFATASVPVLEDANQFPFHGQVIEAVRMTVTDRNALDSPELGIEILAALHRLYPEQFRLDRAIFLYNQATMDALKRGDDPRDIAVSWKATLDAFKARRAKVLLY